MGKEFGEDRMVEQYRQSAADVAAKAKEMRDSGLYSEVTATKDGGLFAIEKGKARHKPEEIEAGKYMAKAGYHVILKDETGSVTTPDGYVYSFTFEQRTPTKGGATFKRALDHAQKKSADVAVVYDKHQVYHRQDVENGIKQFENHSKYRFKRIIVVSKSGNVYEHSHNE